MKEENLETQYTIQMASKISGVGVHTIRAWEKRYNAVVPNRNESGHRSYSRLDVERLIFLGELCQLGYSISKIAGFDIFDLKKTLISLGKSEDSLNNLELNLFQEEEVKIDCSESITMILMALKAYNLDIVSKEIEKLKLVMNSRDFALEVILPIMSDLGDAVYSGEYSIAHEHALSAILKFHIGQILFKENENKIREHITIVICSVEGDYHEFGILMAALIANYYQFNVIYLGPNLPAESIVDVTLSLNAQIVVVGATAIGMNYPDDFLSQYLEKVLNKIPNKIELIIGTGLPLKQEIIKRKNLRHFNSIKLFDKFVKDFF